MKYVTLNAIMISKNILYNYHDIRVETTFNCIRDYKTAIEDDAYAVPIFLGEVSPGFIILHYIICS